MSVFLSFHASLQSYCCVLEPAHRMCVLSPRPQRGPWRRVSRRSSAWKPLQHLPTRPACRSSAVTLRRRFVLLNDVSNAHAAHGGETQSALSNITGVRVISEPPLNVQYIFFLYRHTNIRNAQACNDTGLCIFFDSLTIFCQKHLKSHPSFAWSIIIILLLDDNK